MSSDRKGVRSFAAQLENELKGDPKETDTGSLRALTELQKRVIRFKLEEAIEAERTANAKEKEARDKALDGSRSAQECDAS